MQEHTNAPRTEAVMLSFAVPPDRIEEVLRTMRSLGLSPTHDSTPWRDALGYTAEAMPGVLLSGARYREGLTQAQLAEKTAYYGQEYMDIISGYFSHGYMLPLLAITAFAGGALGGLLGKAVLKKHFAKSGMI